jgi:hypothetical protein
MKRFAYYVLYAIPVVSMLLCLITAALLIRSYFVDDVWIFLKTVDGDRRTQSLQFDLGSRYGGLSVGIQRHWMVFDLPEAEPVVRVQHGWHHDPLPADADQSWLYPLADSVPQNGLTPTTFGWNWRWRGFIVKRGRVYEKDFSRSDWAFSLPHCSIILLTSVLPLIATFKSVKRLRRKRRDLCANCGYDLRATPDRCPECGTLPKMKT